MSGHTIKKYSSHLNWKVELREQVISKLDVINVIDFYHGNGVIWDKIRNDGFKFNLIGIEKNKSISTFDVIKGDNEKIVQTLNFNEFNVFDFDAFTNPLDLMAYCYPRANKGSVFIYTFCINRMCGMPRQFKIFKKVKTITNKYIDEMFADWLFRLGVQSREEIVISENCFLKKYGFFVK